MIKNFKSLRQKKFIPLNVGATKISTVIPNTGTEYETSQESRRLHPAEY